jgi:heat shock protein HslJ
MRTITILFLMVVSAIELQGCSGKTVGTAAKIKTSTKTEVIDTLAEKITSKKWLLTKLLNVSDEKLGSHKLPYIHFDPEKSRIYGFTGCNNFFGNYELNADGSMHLSGIGATKKFCLETMDIENAFLDALKRCRFVSITDSTLILEDQNRNQLAQFIDRH